MISNKTAIKNSITRELTENKERNIPGISTELKIQKVINKDGKSELNIEKPVPDNISEIFYDEKSREDFINNIIKPYVANTIKETPELSKKNRISRLFNFKYNKKTTNEELLNRTKSFLQKNTDYDNDKINNTTSYIVNNLLGNKEIIETIKNDEIAGKSIDIIGKQNTHGYSGMVNNMSNNLMDILQSIPSPNAGLNEIKVIYDNTVGQLEALAIEPSFNSYELEKSIISINNNINRNSEKQKYTDINTGYRNVNVGFNNKDSKLLDMKYVPRAMELYTMEMTNLMKKSGEMGNEEYIKEVSKLHYRFIRIHPFSDGNGRTARAISNMLLLEKGLIAEFDKNDKDEYTNKMKGLNQDIGEQDEYIKGLYTDQSICSNIEENNERVLYKIEEYIGIKCINEDKLYSNRNITERLYEEEKGIEY